MVDDRIAEPHLAPEPERVCHLRRAGIVAQAPTSTAIETAAERNADIIRHSLRDIRCRVGPTMTSQAQYLTRGQFLTATATGIAETRSVDLPGHPQDIAWLAGEPVVLLGPTWANEEPGHAGEIGRVTARGWERYLALPESTWTLAHPPKGTEKLPQPQWRLGSRPARRSR